MKVLITGGAGNLGRKLAELLVASGHEARVFDLPNVDFGPLEDTRGIEIARGDIRDQATVKRAVEGVDAIVHLAALIPPASERDRAFTMAVNVGGTENLIAEGKKTGIDFILASSVATYGDTTGEEPPVKVSHPQTPLDIYSESKIRCEQVVMTSGLPNSILRIAPISIPEPMDPPEQWPYRGEQRVEFVNRDDVAAALCACCLKPEGRGRVFNIAGGSSWQMVGREYVAALYRAMDLEDTPEFSDKPGWFDWYDTAESQQLLRYQNTPFPEFVEQLRRATQAAMGW